MTVPTPVAHRPIYGLPFWRVPVLINSFNRLASLRRLIDWLRQAGHLDLHVIDNASTYPPLLDYLRWLERTRLVKVTRLTRNAGHLALWQQGLLQRLGIVTEYVYTDPDVVPAASCPRDLVGVLQSVLADNPDIATAGVGLRLDDLPDAYRFKVQAIAWERQFWRAPAAPGLFRAPIDTTFALYRPQAGHGLGQPAIRLGWPYVAAHEGWYVNHADPTDEDRFYQGTAARGTSHWSVDEVPAWLRAAVAEQQRRQPCLLHAGRLDAPLPGYLDLAATAETDRLPEQAVDGIYVDGPLEGLLADESFATVMRRLAKPGASLVLHPHLPTAEQILRLLAHSPPLGEGWRLERVTVAANGALGIADAAALAHVVHHAPAKVRRIMAHLRAVDHGTAPAAPAVTVDDLDRWEGFAPVGDR